MASNKFSMLIRSLGTSNVASQMVKPPIQMFGTEGRYATALYSAASKDKKLEAVEKELVQFRASIQKDAKLKEFIINPTIKRAIKVEAMKAIASKTSLTSHSSNLLQLLAENGRLRNLDAIINSFTIIMSAHRGEIVCKVVTARDLEGGQRQQLEQALKSFLKPNQTLQLTVAVDPSIIGGMIVSIGDRYIDMSVSSKVKRYTEIISSAV